MSALEKAVAEQRTSGAPAPACIGAVILMSPQPPGRGRDQKHRHRRYGKYALPGAQTPRSMPGG